MKKRMFKGKSIQSRCSDSKRHSFQLLNFLNEVINSMRSGPSDMIVSRSPCFGYMLGFFKGRLMGLKKPQMTKISLKCVQPLTVFGQFIGTHSVII